MPVKGQCAFRLVVWPSLPDLEGERNDLNSNKYGNISGSEMSEDPATGETSRSQEAGKSMGRSNDSGNSRPQSKSGADLGGTGRTLVESGAGFLESLWEVARTVVYAVLIAAVVRTFAYEPFNIPSGSMIPTLLVGDHLFVSKYSYGYSRYSFPFSLPLFEGRIFQSMPERGDVAVFRRPGNEQEDYIKRIIGLPGDRIQVIGGVLNINGQPVKREKIADYVEYGSAGATVFAQYLETLPNGRRHKIIEYGDDNFYDNTEVFTVPEGHVFAMGDNRDDSRDSRDLQWVGFIPVANLVGRAEFLFFSTDGTAEWWEFWNWPTATRFSRILSSVD